MSPPEVIDHMQAAGRRGCRKMAGRPTVHDAEDRTLIQSHEVGGHLVWTQLWECEDRTLIQSHEVGGHLVRTQFWAC